MLNRLGMRPDQVIQQILYISTVSPHEAVNLPSILTVARRNNDANGITGLLMFNGKRFLQVLEGPVDAVEQTFERIRSDPRHRAQVVLTRRIVEQREFGGWSMAFPDDAHKDKVSFVEDICSKSGSANANLRAELMAFARQI